MPTKFRGSIHSVAECVRQRPECAVLIGAIAAEWSLVESMLAQFFAFFVFGLRDTRLQDGGEYVALDIMERTLAFRAKTSLLLRAAEFRFGETDPDCVEMEKRLDALAKVCKDRNRIIHARWSLSDKHPHALIWRGRISDADTEVHEPGDFETALKKILKAEGELSIHFGTKFQPRLKGVLKNRLGYTLTIQ